MAITPALSHSDPSTGHREGDMKSRAKKRSQPTPKVRYHQNSRRVRAEKTQNALPITNAPLAAGLIQDGTLSNENIEAILSTNPAAAAVPSP